MRFLYGGILSYTPLEVTDVETREHERIIRSLTECSEDGLAWLKGNGRLEIKLLNDLSLSREWKSLLTDFEGITPPQYTMLRDMAEGRPIVVAGKEAASLVRLLYGLVPSTVASHLADMEVARITLARESNQLRILAPKEYLGLLAGTGQRNREFVQNRLREAFLKPEFEILLRLLGSRQD